METALLWLRSRERQSPAVELKLDQLYDNLYTRAGACRSPSWEKSYKGTYVLSKERIQDNETLERRTKFTPGVFKVTGIQRDRVRTNVPQIEAKIFYKMFTCPMRYIVGDCIPGMVGLSPYANYLSVPYVDLSWVPRLALEACANMQKPDVGFAETFGEAAQALDMMRNPMKGLRKIFRKTTYKRNGRKRAPADAASAWLEYRYGWTPLYATAKDAYNFAYPKIDSLLSSRAKEVVQDDLASTTPGWYRSSSSVPWCLLRSVSTAAQETRRVQYYYNIADYGLFKSFRRGSSVFQIPSLMWEFTPYSFVADWWFNIGDWISAMTPNPSVTVKGFTVSIKKLEKTGVLLHSATFPYPWTGQGLQFDPIMVQAYSEREFYLRLPQPVPEIPLPHLDLHFNSLKHAIDGVALAIQRGR